MYKLRQWEPISGWKLVAEFQEKKQAINTLHMYKSRQPYQAFEVTDHGNKTIKKLTSKTYISNHAVCRGSQRKGYGAMTVSEAIAQAKRY